ncbi:tail fiber protein [Stenotrophomonas phage Pokken]|uniref:Putative tail fiber protein n=1 Tax=Stenotrophomonas phage Pokken TaxID=2596674 RepID=A0A5B9N928_9CAUD|nr:tail fiber protein [Stenotrophomonas phage Pokken]QEG09305.1 putative tail fiber protein [Stenotrophomonas phage Pokken]
MIPERSQREIVGPWVEQQNRLTRPLIDYERGGSQLFSASDNLQEVLWTAEYVDGKVIVYRPGVDPITVITEAGITQIALGFDQLMRPHIAYMAEGGVCKFYWFDTQVNAMRTMIIPDATTPRLCMDEKRDQFQNSSDLILSYKKGMDLCIRVQRQRYQNEILIDRLIEGDLISVGMNNKNRLQWFCVGHRYVPPINQSKPVTFVGANDWIGTSESQKDMPNIPGLKSRDLLLAYIVHRSSVPIPTGWFLVAETETYGSGATNQKLLVLGKVANTADETTATYRFNQTNTSRFLICLSAFRSEYGPVIKDIVVNPLAPSPSNVLTVNFPSHLNTAPDSMLIAVGSHASISNGTVTNTPSNMVRMDTANITTDKRLYAGYVPLPTTGQTTLSSFTQPASSDYPYGISFVVSGLVS